MMPDIVWKNADNTLRILARRYNDSSVELTAEGLDEHGYEDEQCFNVSDAEQATAIVTYLQDFIKSRPVRVSHATEWNVFDGALWVGGVPVLNINGDESVPSPCYELVSKMLTGGASLWLFNNIAYQTDDISTERHILDAIAHCKEMSEF
jgi:hypothetical protein